MNKNTTIHVRVNENVRANAEETLSMLGMTISDAVNMLLHQVNLVGGLPFDLKIPASARNIVRNSTELHQKLDETESDFKAWKDNHYISRWFIEKDHGVLLEVTPFDIIPVEVINDYEK